MSQDDQSQRNPSPDNSSWQQPQQPPQQTYYEQPQWQQPPQPQFDQQQWQQPQPNQYNQFNQPQYSANQYGVPSYAQAQPQSDQTSNFLTRWLMMGIAIRIVLLVLIPLLLCGGCALIVFISSLAHP